jgi:hypothetical protein
MKLLTIICVAALSAMLLVPASCSARGAVCEKDGRDNFCRDDGVDLSFDDGSIVFTHEDDDETVEITDEYELIVNGGEVRLDADERRLVRKYYESFEHIIEEAKEIGIEGAKIGVQGAKLGVAATIGALRLLSPYYDRDDLEDELDNKSEKIERVAAKLEKRANKLERRAKALEGLHDQLRSEIDELDELGWF